MIYMLLGVDGTGEYSETEYKESFRNSFVKRLTGGVAYPNRAHYLRGPSLDGFSTGKRGEVAASELTNFLNCNIFPISQPKLFLTGYSRGGAAVIHAAKILNERKIAVDAMFLFDAVDRTPTVDQSLISENVKIVYHALRAPSTKSRESFANTGLKAANPRKTTVISREFACTHGGVGGTPWNGKNPDALIQEHGTLATKAGEKMLSAAASSPLSFPIMAPEKVLLAAGGLAALALGQTGKTTVSYHLDRTNSDEVWRWMKGNFDHEAGQWTIA